MGLRSYIEKEDAAYNWHSIFRNWPSIFRIRNKIVNIQNNPMSAYPFHSGRSRARALSILLTITLIALVIGLSSAAFGANPASEMAKMGTTDPKGDSWQAIQNSLDQFAHPEFMLRLFLSLSLAVACAWAIAWHPRRSSLTNPLSDLEERKTLILLGMVGAIVAELSGSSQTLAFVIFGIGALLRFRTVLDNPKLVGKAITVVVVGLACGMGSWAMAVFVTAFSWLLVFWLDSHASCRIRIRLEDGVDPQPIFGLMQSLLVSHHCRLQSSALYEDKGQMVFILYIPAGIDPRKLEAEMRAKLKKSDTSKIDVEVV
jgi:hypothetical protein